MCISPILIKNPNKGKLNDGKYMRFKDCSSDYIRIPCGHCPQCISSKQMQLVQRVQMESIKNHIFFCTCTYNNQMIPTVLTSTGFSIRYASIEDVQNMIKRVRKRDPVGRPLRYFCVSELGSLRGRPHFHILWLVPKESSDDLITCLNFEHSLHKCVLQEWSRNIGTRKNPIYKPCCDYIVKNTRNGVRSTFDLHYVNPKTTDGAEGDVAFYVLKYMLKPSNREVRLQQALHMNLDKDEYEDVWKLVRPRYIKSEGFGLNSRKIDSRGSYSLDPDIVKIIRGSVERGKGSFEYPVLFNPVNGNPFPLSRFYKNHKSGSLYTLDDAEFFYFENDSPFVDSVTIIDPKEPSQINVIEHQYSHNCDLVEKTSIDIDIENLLFNN